MQKIVDNSFLQDEHSLRAFLGESPRNIVVLSDYSAMETYRAGSIDALNKVTSVLSVHPSQVVVLKGSTKISGLSGRSAGLQRRLIDEAETSYFPNFCREVAMASKGHSKNLDVFSQHVNAANEQLSVLLAHAELMAKAYDDIGKIFTQEEMKVIRTSETYTPSIARKLVQFIAELSVPLIQQHPRGSRKLRKEEMPNLFAFRLTVCNTVLMLRWLAVGGAKSTAPERLRNDMVDCHIAAYGTYFDGLLTKDHKQAQIFARSRHILSTAFGV